MQHLDENTIDALLAGRLSEDARASVTDHLGDCSACRVLVSDLQRVIAGGSRSSATLLEPAPPGDAAHPTFPQNALIANRYRIVRFVAEGGMGEVYEAEDLELHTRVALKTVRQEIAAHPRILERFKREILTARSVTHANVCRIFDLGVHAGSEGQKLTFFTMEFLEGETLSERIARAGRFSTRDALPLVSQLADALAAAHAAGIVHRDFKSPNVMLVPDGASVRAVVTDFGLARGTNVESAAITTNEGTLHGSPAYMAPEQVSGKTIGAPADLYALGVVVFEMVTGALPFLEETAMLTAVKRLHAVAPSPRTLARHLDPRWERAILRCLAREPADRFSSVTDFVAALSTPGRRRDVRPFVVGALALSVAAALAAHQMAKAPSVPAAPTLAPAKTSPAPAAIAPRVPAQSIEAPPAEKPKRAHKKLDNGDQRLIREYPR
jgi:tRNA A-37 threonylcarbamoyl transferase component Bud32